MYRPYLRLESDLLRTEKLVTDGIYIAVVVIKMKGGETKSYTEEVSLIR